MIRYARDPDTLPEDFEKYDNKIRISDGGNDYVFDFEQGRLKSVFYDDLYHGVSYMKVLGAGFETEIRIQDAGMYDFFVNVGVNEEISRVIKTPQVNYNTITISFLNTMPKQGIHGITSLEIKTTRDPLEERISRILQTIRFQSQDIYKKIQILFLSEVSLKIFQVSNVSKYERIFFKVHVFKNKLLNKKIDKCHLLILQEVEGIYQKIFQFLQIL